MNYEICCVVATVTVTMVTQTSSSNPLKPLITGDRYAQNIVTMVTIAMVMYLNVSVKDILPMQVSQSSYHLSEHVADEGLR